MSGIQIVIDSDGGGGHIAVANAVEKEWNESSRKGCAPHTTRRINFLKENQEFPVIGSVKLPFIGNLGEYSAQRWNEAQKRGDIAELEATANLRWISDIIFYPIAFKKFTEYLRSMDQEPERIVCTQALCIDAIAQAILVVNREKNWNMRLQVHMTDLPTKRAEHFFKSLNSIGNNPALTKIVTLYAPCRPKCRDGQTEKSFWKKHVGKIRVIYTKKLPIRKAFFEHQCTIGEHVELRIKVHNDHEKQILNLGMSSEHNVSDKKATINIGSEDKVATIMLGSQPPGASVNGYIDAFLQAALKEAEFAPESLNKHYLFVYCGKPDSETESNELLAKVETRLRSYQSSGGLPENFKIIPFTHQDDDTLAPLLHRSNVLVQKTGGSSCFEAMHIYQDEKHQQLPKEDQRTIFIHSEGIIPKGSAITDTLYEIWLAIMDFFKWFFLIQDKDAIDENSFQPLTEKDLLNIHEKCSSLALMNREIKLEETKHPFSNSSYELRLPQNDNIRKILKKIPNNEEKRCFSESERELFIETRAEMLMQQCLKNRNPNDPLPEQKAMYKMAIEQLLIERGIPLWEAGNAETLQHMMGSHAKIVSPNYIGLFLNQAFFSRSGSPRSDSLAESL